MPMQYFTRIPNDIFDQLIMCDFTKRQLKILLQIIRGSFGFHKAEAFIPKLELFEYAGVSQRVVSKEIKTLLEKNVLLRHVDTNEYSINPDLSSWKVELANEKATLCRAEYLKCNARHRTGGVQSSTYKPRPEEHQQHVGSDQHNIGPEQQNVGGPTYKTWDESPTKRGSGIHERPRHSWDADIRIKQKDHKENVVELHNHHFIDDPYVEAAIKEDATHE